MTEGDIEPSWAFSVDPTKAGFIEIEEEGGAHRRTRIPIQRIEPCTLRIIELLVTHPTCLLFFQNPLKGLPEFRQARLEVLIESNQVRIDITGVYVTGDTNPCLRKESKKDAPPAEEGFVVITDVRGKTGKNGGKELGFSTDPFQRRRERRRR